MIQDPPLIPIAIARRFRDFLAAGSYGKVTFNVLAGKVVSADLLEHVKEGPLDRSEESPSSICSSA